MGNTTEQLAGTEEQVTALETEQPKPASDEKAQTSTEHGKIDFSSPEFQKAIETSAFRIAQSLKDKELKPLYERLNKAEASVKDAEVERKLDTEYNQLVESGEPETQVRSLQEKEKEVRKLHKEAILKADTVNAELAKMESDKATIYATRALIGKLHPETVSLLKEQIDHLIKVSKGDPETMEELAESVVAKFKTKSPDKPLVETVGEKPKRPDSSLHSAPGGDSDAAIRANFTKNPFDPKTREAYLNLIKKK